MDTIGKSFDEQSGLWDVAILIGGEMDILANYCDEEEADEAIKKLLAWKSAA